ASELRRSRSSGHLSGHIEPRRLEGGGLARDFSSPPATPPTPLLGEPLGGSAGLVDVEVRTDRLDQPVGPGRDYDDVLFEERPGVAALSPRDERREGHAVSQVTNLLRNLLIVSEGRNPLFTEDAYRRTTFVNAQHLRSPDSIGSEVPH